MKQTPYEAEVIKRTKEFFNTPGKPKATTSTKRKHKKKCEGIGLNNARAACTRVANHERKWAGHTLKYCSVHAEMWDDAVTNALLGWEDVTVKDAIQVKSAAT